MRFCTSSLKLTALLQVYDNPVLGMWVHEIRKKAKEKKLDDETFARLDAIGFCWTVDQQSAKWHYLLHEARRYRVSPPMLLFDDGTGPRKQTMHASAPWFGGVEC
jgi:Helicase associated domain